MSSVTLVHPTKVTGWNEMPFDRDTCVVPSNSTLDRGPSPPQKEDLQGRNPHFAAVLPNAKFLWPRFSYSTLQLSPKSNLLGTVVENT